MPTSTCSPFERKEFVFTEVKIDKAAGTFQGYGSTFGNIDLGNDRVNKGAFIDTLAVFKSRGQLPAMFNMHDWNQQVGDWLKMEEDSKGLFVAGALWVKGNKLGATPIEAAEQVRNGLIGTGPKGLSIGYRAREWKYSVETEGDEQREVRDLIRVDLQEVSTVPFGMNELATVTAAKSLSFVGESPTEKRAVERILRDAGFSNRDAKAFISGGWASLTRDEQGEADNALLEALKNFKH